MKIDWKYEDEFARVSGFDHGGVRITVADVYGYDVAERDAHGHLVAAAPDMLEALELWLECADNHGVTCRCGRDARDKAVAKAKGGRS